MKSESLQSLKDQKRARHLQHFLGIKEKLKKKFRRDRTVYYCPRDDTWLRHQRGRAFKVVRVYLKGRRRGAVGGEYDDISVEVEVKSLDAKFEVKRISPADLKLEGQCKKCSYRLDRVVRGCPGNLNNPENSMP